MYFSIDSTKLHNYFIMYLLYTAALQEVNTGLTKINISVIQKKITTMNMNEYVGTKFAGSAST